MSGHVILGHAVRCRGLWAVAVGLWAPSGGLWAVVGCGLWLWAWAGCGLWAWDWGAGGKGDMCGTLAWLAGWPGWLGRYAVAGRVLRGRKIAKIIENNCEWPASGLQVACKRLASGLQ